MKKSKWFLLLLALALVIGAAVGSSYAYFTTYSTGRGGYIVHMGNRTEIHEEALGSKQDITIKNTGDYPVFVRVKIFAGSNITVEPAFSSEYWEKRTEGGQDVYRYLKTLEKGEETGRTGETWNDGKLTFDLTIPKGEDVKEGDEVNVVIIYESVPAVFRDDGSPDLDTAWSIGKVTVIQ